jgi:hypothetical protein
LYHCLELSVLKIYENGLVFAWENFLSMLFIVWVKNINNILDASCVLSAGRRE